MSDIVAEGAAAPTRYVTGAIYGVSAVCIWALWIVITRQGVKSSLSAYDITMLRFATAGLILLPVALRKGLALKQLGWARWLILVCGAGAPYVLVASSGLRFAPAAHGGAMLPGSMPLFVALLSLLMLKESFSPSRKLGYALIAGGVLVIVDISSLNFGEQTRGHALFLSAAFIWSCYAIALRQSRLNSLHATALVSVGSCLLYLPFYFAWKGLHVLDAPMRDIAFQALFQGVIVSIVALFLFGKAIETLGASAGAAFGALTPALAALLAIPILGEFPSAKDWLAILSVSAGVYLASGGALPKRRAA